MVSITGLNDEMRLGWRARKERRATDELLAREFPAGHTDIPCNCVYGEVENNGGVMCNCTVCTGSKLVLGKGSEIYGCKVNGYVELGEGARIAGANLGGNPRTVTLIGNNCVLWKMHIEIFGDGRIDIGDGARLYDGYIRLDNGRACGIRKLSTGPGLYMNQVYLTATSNLFIGSFATLANTRAELRGGAVARIGDRLLLGNFFEQTSGGVTVRRANGYVVLNAMSRLIVGSDFRLSGRIAIKANDIDIGNNVLVYNSQTFNNDAIGVREMRLGSCSVLTLQGNQGQCYGPRREAYGVVSVGYGGRLRLDRGWLPDGGITVASGEIYK